VLTAIAGGELSLEFHLDAELHTGDRVAMTDSDLLQVLMNLVSNTRDATNGHGHIVVSTGLKHESGRQWLRIEFSDDGPGIPSTLRGSAFDPFTSSKGPGHGLGLPTVRTLVEMADGRIELIDDGEPGTTFVIVLPLID
jgi:signal transduction histidine kinase